MASHKSLHDIRPILEISNNHNRLVSAPIFFNDGVNWFFNDTLSANSTTLLANFINGNTDAFRSRVYLWNPSTSAGTIQVRVFTMPRSLTPEPSELLGTLELDLLEGESARTIKIEDALSPLGILPYKENGGNLTLEFTIDVPGVQGTAQVFNNSLTLAFGTYPLQIIE